MFDVGDHNASSTLVRTSNKTQLLFLTQINRLILFKEIITVYYENHIKPTNTLCGQNTELLFVKAGGIFYWSFN
jgi:hypothetical protein